MTLSYLVDDDVIAVVYLDDQEPLENGFDTEYPRELNFIIIYQGCTWFVKIGAWTFKFFSNWDPDIN